MNSTLGVIADKIMITCVEAHSDPGRKEFYGAQA
jgi:hypothetical protein